MDINHHIKRLEQKRSWHKILKLGFIVLILLITGLRTYNKYERKQLKKEQEQEQRKAWIKAKEKVKQDASNQQLKLKEQQQDSLQKAKKKAHDKRSKLLRENIQNLDNELSE